MTNLHLYGFSSNEAAALQECVPTVSDQSVTERLYPDVAEDALWVVNASAVHSFLQEVYPSLAARMIADVPALLWVPAEKSRVDFDVWWEWFHDQLEAEDEDDCSFLERAIRCPSVLSWAALIEEIPSSSLENLASFFQPLDLAKLPLQPEARAHLNECADCQAEVAYRIQSHNLYRQWFCCPSVEETAVWLTGASDARLEKHLRQCLACREIIMRQAWLWFDGGLIDKSQLDAKLLKLSVDQGVWFTAPVEQQQAQQVAGWLVLAMMTRLKMQSQLRSESAQSPLENETIDQRLNAGEPITLADATHWMQVKRQQEDLLVRAGRNSVDRFQEFYIEFCRGKEVILFVEAQNGVVRIPRAAFDEAATSGCDHIVIRANSFIGDQQ